MIVFTLMSVNDHWIYGALIEIVLFDSRSNAFKEAELQQSNATSSRLSHTLDSMAQFE